MDKIVVHKSGQLNKEFPKIELKLNMLRDLLHDVQEDMTTNLFNTVLIALKKAIH